MRALFTFAVGLVFSITAAQTTINKNFSVKNSEKIFLKFDYPQLIRISTWDKNEVEISGTVNINANENNSAFQIKESQDGNSLVIEGEIPEIENLPRRITARKGNEKIIFKTLEEYEQYCKTNKATFSSISDGADINIDLEIRVPKSLKTYIESTYGMVEVKNFEAEIAVNAKYGGIDAVIKEKSTGTISAETYYGQIYSNLNAKFNGKDADDFRMLVTATPGNGPQYRLESQYGNIYLRK